MVNEIQGTTIDKEWFESLLDDAPEALAVVADDGRVLRANRGLEELAGRTRQELVGRHVTLLLPPRQREAEHVRALAARTVEGPARDVPFLGCRSDGTEVPVELSVSRTGAGPGAAYVVIVRDVTGRSDVLSTVSHELRAPVTAIQGFAEWLIDAWDSAPETRKREVLERIVGAAGRAERLVEDMLEVSRFDRGRLRIDPRGMALAPLVRKVVEQAGPALAAHRLAVHVDEDARVRADAAALGRVVENLLTNAAKFSPAGSTVQVWASTEGKEVTLAVRDRGTGIAPEDQARIFDRFYRVPQTASQAPGAGVGLAIADQFMRAQGGRITVDSHPGEGSTFTLHLPVSDD